MFPAGRPYPSEACRRALASLLPGSTPDADRASRGRAASADGRGRQRQAHETGPAGARLIRTGRSRAGGPRLPGPGLPLSRILPTIIAGASLGRRFSGQVPHRHRRTWSSWPENPPADRDTARKRQPARRGRRSHPRRDAPGIRHGHPLPGHGRSAARSWAGSAPRGQSRLSGGREPVGDAGRWPCRRCRARLESPMSSRMAYIPGSTNRTIRAAASRPKARLVTSGIRICA